MYISNENKHTQGEYYEKSNSIRTVRQINS